MRAVRTFTVAANLPPELASLNEIARNLSWSSDARVQDLFRRIDPHSWDLLGRDAFGFLSLIPQERFDALAEDSGYVASANEVLDELTRGLDAPHWFDLNHAGELRSVAYLSPEFGIASALPQYAGGLGVLAGDHLRTASDLGIPLVGVGLLYTHGYFRQWIDQTGRQHAQFPRFHPEDMPLEEVEDAEVTVDLAGVPVKARVWRATVGRVSLYLLDTDVDGNAPEDRKVTDRLYGGGREERIRQEIVLGIGGLYALDALGIQPEVFHLNEGHAGFLALERVRRSIRDEHLTFPEAIEANRSSQVFTTHTPVPAGIDRFSREIVEKYFSGWARDCGLSIDDLLALGHEPGTEPGTELNLAVMSLRLSGYSNGVAQLHGEVSRQMFADVWPGVPLDEVPIDAITNGVHAHTWVSREMSDLIERHVGWDWPDADEQRWAAINAVPDEELWAVRRANRERLVEATRMRVRDQVLRRGFSEAQTEWVDEVFDPSILTIGFGRRFAPYKRATLLMTDPERLRRLLLDPERPLQIVFAGKAHPADEPGKELVARIAATAADIGLRHRFVFLEDFGISLARMMYRGADVWLNNPRRPMEACGTSGMKVVLNGGLHCSTLDGWWAECYEADLGWAIPSAEYLPDEERDPLEAESLYQILEEELVPEFYDRDHDGIPRAWIRRVKNSLTRLGPRVTANRMVREYVERGYIPAAKRAAELTARHDERAKSLVAWKQRVRAHWNEVAVERINDGLGRAEIGTTEKVTADVRLGALSPDDVKVELVYGPIDLEDEIRNPRLVEMAKADASEHGLIHYEAMVECSEPGPHGVTVRVIPSHPDLASYAEVGCITWPPER